MRSSRIPGLDGIRYLAALMIVLHHAGFASMATFQSAAGPYLARLDVGVSVFFVLSGFLLYLPFVSRQLGDRPAPDVSDYYAKRVVRIYPAYLAALWLTLVIGGTVVGDAEGFIHTSLLTHVYIPIRSLSGLPQSWSLAAEVVFYLALPGLAWLGWRWAAGAPPHRRPARLLAAIGLLYAGSLAFRIFAEHWAPERYRGVMALWMPAQVDHFAIGMGLAVLAVWAQQNGELDRLLTTTFRAAGRWWLVAAGLLWFTSTQLELARGLDRAAFGPEVLRQGLYGAIALAVVAPFALCPHEESPLRSALDHPIAQWLGRISYGLYLWHLWIISQMPVWRDVPPFTLSFPELALAGTVLGTLAAAASFHLLEEPLNSLLRGRLLKVNRLGTADVRV